MPPGPPPKPNAIKELEGNPGKRRLKNNPKPERVLGLKAPAHIGKFGKQEWNRITPELSRLGLLTRIDQGALEMYCESYQRWREAVAFIAKNGTTFETRHPDILDDAGNVKTRGGVKYIQQYPQVSIAAQCREYCRKTLSEFGLSPGARARFDIDIGFIPTPASSGNNGGEISQQASAQVRPFSSLLD